MAGQLGYVTESMAAVAKQMEVAVNDITSLVQQQMARIDGLTGGPEFQGGAGLAFKASFTEWKGRESTMLIQLQNMSANLNLAAGRVEDNEAVLRSLMSSGGQGGGARGPGAA